MSRPLLQWIELKGWPIARQLQLEEYLLQDTQESWWIWNHGAPPAIVLGLSNRLEEWVDLEVWRHAPCPILRRRSAGGAVVIDQNTLFSSWVVAADHMPSVAPWSTAVLAWASSLCAPLGITVDAQDFVLEDRKIGGNAQCFTKGRWIHHTSFLWDYAQSHMEKLLPPPHTPQYRRGRSHGAFCGRLCTTFDSPATLLACLHRELSRSWQVERREVGDVLARLPTERACRVATLLWSEEAGSWEEVALSPMCHYLAGRQHPAMPAGLPVGRSVLSTL